MNPATRKTASLTAFFLSALCCVAWRHLRTDTSKVELPSAKDISVPLPTLGSYGH